MFTYRYTREIPDLVYPPPCNGVIGHGAQIRGLRVFADHAHRNKRKTNASTTFARRALFYACLSSRLDRSRCRWLYAPDEPRLFWLLEKPEDPNLNPWGDKSGAGSGTSIVYLCLHYIWWSLWNQENWENIFWCSYRLLNSVSFQETIIESHNHQTLITQTIYLSAAILLLTIPRLLLALDLYS